MGSYGQRFQLGKRFIGIMLKFGFSIFYQEDMVVFDHTSALNKLGAALMPDLNALADWISGFDNLPPVRDGDDIYPGSRWCRPADTAHAKWHEESANFFVDVLLAADFAGQLFRDNCCDRMLV